MLFLSNKQCNCWKINRCHQIFLPLVLTVTVIVQSTENAIIIFFFIPFPHLLGKTEEECSFHTLKALFPSRKWATEDTKITLPSSNAGDMGSLSEWYATCLISRHNSFYTALPFRYV